MCVHLWDLYEGISYAIDIIHVFSFGFTLVIKLIRHYIPVYYESKHSNLMSIVDDRDVERVRWSYQSDCLKTSWIS